MALWTLSTDAGLYPRHLAPLLAEALADTPAVLINGPRQCGKTTLAKQLAGGAMGYLTLDDPAVLTAVRSDPVGFARRLDRAVIDEVQRAPELLLALKLVIDEDRRPGRFLLTGSANLLALPQMSDSLAGRMEVHTLLPFSQAETQRRDNDFLERAQTMNWGNLPPPDGPSNLVDHVLAGGYPEMRQRKTLARRQAWARAYIQTLVERDVQDVAAIEHLSEIPPLLNAAAALCGQLFNVSQIANQFRLNARTIEKYLGVLEKLFLIERLPPWGRNEFHRLIKTPKLHFLDAGLQATLMRMTPDWLLTHRERWGATLETWVYGELRKMLSIAPGRWNLSHYRDKDQVEVDFVLETPLGGVMGVEVKAAASVQAGDFKGLKRLQSQTGSDFMSGIVLYDGQHALPMGDRLWAVPFRAL